MTDSHRWRESCGSRDVAHGDAIDEQLAADLRRELSGIAVYLRRKVFYMREFYLAYRDQPKVQPLVAPIGWTHNLIVLQRCKDPLEREFYIRMTRKFGWTKNVRRRVVAVLSTYDDLIENKRRRMALL
jgi:Protein of unknown function (DUF1016).